MCLQGYQITVLFHPSCCDIFLNCPWKDFGIPLNGRVVKSPFSWIIVFPEGLIHANSRQQEQFWDLCLFSNFSFSFKLELHFVLFDNNPCARWAERWEEHCLCLSHCYSSLHADSCCPRGSTEQSDPAPNHCSCSALTYPCQWDLPLLAHKKSLIKYYCGAFVCVTAEPGIVKQAWSEGQPWPAVNLVATGTGEKFCLQEAGGKIWH